MIKNAKSKPRGVIPFLLALVAAILYLNGVVIAAQLDYIPPTKTFRGNEIMVEAEVTNSNDRPYSAWVHYRNGNQGAFIPLEMEIDQWSLLAFIPAEDVQPPAMEYYVEVEYESGQKENFPQNAPGADSYRVNVVSLKSGKDYQPIIEIISPEPGEKFMEGDDVLIAFSIAQHLRRVDPANLRIELNGRDITSKAYKTETVVSLLLKNMQAGSNMLSIFEGFGNDEVRLNNWNFTVEREEIRAYGPDLPFDGNASVKFNHEDIGSRTRDVTMANLNLRGGEGDLKWAGKVYVSSLEDAKLQPQNRYLGMVKYKKATLKVGDTSPRFSQFSIYGNRTRGVELNLDGKGFGLDVAVGNLTRAIDGVNDGTSITNGTYRRSLLAIKPSFGLSRNSKLSFNIMKAKDDVKSIEYGSNPKDNLIIGTGLDWSSNSRRITISSETAVSFYNSNIAGGPMEQAAKLEDIIVVNQFFDPLPADESILDEDVSQVELAKKVWGELFKSSMAHQTGLGLKYFGNDLSFTFKTVGRSFKSLGSNGVSTDTRGFTIADRLRLFDSKVYLNIAYDAYQDNVNGRKPDEETLKRTTISGGISYYTAPHLPNISFNVRQYGRENGDTYDYFQLPDGTADSTGNPVSDNSMSYSVSLDQSLKFGETEHSAVLSFNNSFSEDDYNPNAASDNRSIGIRIGSKLTYRLNTSFAFNTTTQNSLNKANNIDYNSINVGAKYKVIPRKFRVNGSVGMNFASGGNDELNPQPDPGIDPATVLRSSNIEFSRMQLSAGAEYMVGSNHRFGLNAYKVFHTDDSYTTNWNDDKSFNKDSATFVAQDDFVTRLQYTYTF